MFKELEVTKLPLQFEVLHGRRARLRAGELDLDCDLLRSAEVPVTVQGQLLHSKQFLPHEGLMEDTDTLQRDRPGNTLSAPPQREPGSVSPALSLQFLPFQICFKSGPAAPSSPLKMLHCLANRALS